VNFRIEIAFIIALMTAGAAAESPPRLPETRPCLKALFKLLGADANKHAPPKPQSENWRRWGQRYDAGEGHRPKVVLDKTLFPYRGVKGEVLQYADQRYRIVNVGYFQAGVDRPLIDAAHKAAVGDKPFQKVNIEYAGEKLKGASYLSQMSRQIKYKVQQVYRTKKDFLRSDDFKAIEFNDLYDNASDIFVILKDRGISPELLTVQQFDEDALMTIRISHAHSHDVMVPTEFDYGSSGGLPLLGRAKDSREIHLVENQLSAHKRVAELTRFARFGEVPAPIRDAMLYRVFSMARSEERPIDIFLASMDREIRNYLEKPWGFKELMPFDTGQGSVPEYLMYLKTDSPEFEAALKRFADSAKDTQVRDLPDHPQHSLPK